LLSALKLQKKTSFSRKENSFLLLTRSASVVFFFLYSEEPSLGIQELGIHTDNIRTHQIWKKRCTVKLKQTLYFLLALRLPPISTAA